MEDTGAKPTQASTIISDVLLNSDLLAEIFFFLRPTTIDGRHIARQHLLWTALTCKVFLDPALNVLWRDIESLLPLLKLLPTFRLLNNVYVLCGIVEDNSWSRFDHYARRVRAFSAEVSPSGAADPVIQLTYSRLIQLRSNVILPSIHELRCPAVGIMFPSILLFLSPSLRVVELSGILASQDHLIGSIISTLACEVPTLKHLILRGQLTGHCLEFIPALQHLRSLELCATPNSEQALSLDEIGTLLRLEDAVVDLPNAQYGGNSGFKALKSLHATGNPSFLFKMFSGVAASDMVSITVVLASTPSSATGNLGLTKEQLFGRCMESICSRWSHSMRTLVVDSSQSPIRVPMTELLPLSRLPNLEKLFLGKSQMTLLENDVELIASACPKLKSLQLPFNNNLTFAALRSLAHGCSCLGYLHIHLEPSNIRSFPTDRRDVSNRSLATLSVGSGIAVPAGDQPVLARQLDRLFPRLKTMQDETSQGGSAPWRGVFELVQMCQAARLDERDLVRDGTAINGTPHTGWSSAPSSAEVKLRSPPA